MGNPGLTFAIIGCGRIAERHAEHIQKWGVLQAVCDIVRVNAQALGEKYNSRIYNNIDDLLNAEKDLNVVVVCTPNGLHATHTIKALNTGADVLCEKPMALTAEDCKAMIQAAEQNNRRLFIVKQNRFNPPVVAVKQAIDKGILGRIYSVQLNCFWNRNDDYYANSWKGTKHLDGGILFTQFSHFVDLLYWMMGDVKKVHTLTGNFAHKQSIEFEDTCVVAFEFNNGALGTMHFTINSHRKNMEGSVTIFAENGTVKIGGQYLNELEYQDIHDYKIKGLPAGNVANNYGAYVGSMSNHDKVYANLADVIHNGAAINAGALDGLKTVEIIEKIYAAAQQQH